MSPYKSDAQRKYFNANKAQLEKQGVNVDEWNDASKGQDVPKHVKRKTRFSVGFKTHTKGTV